MTKKELNIIQDAVSKAWLAMAEYEQTKHEDGYFRFYSDIAKFEETDGWYAHLRNYWYQLSLLADKLGVDWSNHENCEKAFTITSQLWSCYHE